MAKENPKPMEGEKNVTEVSLKEQLESYLLPEMDLVINSLENKKEMIFTIIPELKAEEGFEHKHPHHAYDVWKHTLVAMERSKPDLQVRLALFRGHPKKSEEMTKVILTRLGYSPKEIADICYLVENHDTIININKVEEHNRALIEKQLHMQYCDAYAHHPDHIEKRIKKLNQIKKRLEERVEEGR